MKDILKNLTIRDVPIYKILIDSKSHGTIASIKYTHRLDEENLTKDEALFTAIHIVKCVNENAKLREMLNLGEDENLISEIEGLQDLIT